MKNLPQTKLHTDMIPVSNLLKYFPAKKAKIETSAEKTRKFIHAPAPSLEQIPEQSTRKKGGEQ